MRTKTRAAAPAARSRPPHPRQPGDRHGRRRGPTAPAMTDLHAEALGQVEQPAGHGLGDDAVVAPPGVAGDRQRQRDHDRGHREPDAEDEPRPAMGARAPCAPPLGRQRPPSRAMPTATAGASGTPMAAIVQTPCAVVAVARQLGRVEPVGQARWAPGPGRPSSTASSAAAPRCRPRPRRPPRPARRRAVAAPPAAIAGASAAVAAPDYRSPDRPPATEVPVTSPVAILSDIHGNRPALDATLRAAREAGAESWWCLGDLVGYGADPRHCIEVAMGDSERCIAGNHDLGAPAGAQSWTCSPTAPARRWSGPARPSGSSGHASLLRLDPEDTGGVVPLFHGSPRDPVWEYVLTVEQARDALEDRRVALTLVGHTHVPFAWRLTTDGAMESPRRAGRGAARPERGAVAGEPRRGGPAPRRRRPRRVGALRPRGGHDRVPPDALRRGGGPERDPRGGPAGRCSPTASPRAGERPDRLPRPRRRAPVLDPRVVEAMRPFLGAQCGEPVEPARVGAGPPRRWSGPATRWPRSWAPSRSGSSSPRAPPRPATWRSTGLLRANVRLGRHIVTSAVEHPATVAACRSAVRDGGRPDAGVRGRGGLCRFRRAGGGDA